MTAVESITIIGAMIILMGGLFAVVKWGVGIAIDGLRGEMRASFDSIEKRLDGIDTDVQKLTEKYFGQ